jgi:hypothetical protein
MQDTLLIQPVLKDVPRGQVKEWDALDLRRRNNMPYPGVPTSKTPKMERCVERVMRGQGKSKSSAIAICHTSVMGKKKGKKK